MSYLLSWLAAYVIIGSFWYVADRLLGVKVYRWFYDMTHRDPLPASEVQGFIYRRKAQGRFFTAVVLAIGQGAIITSHTNDGPLIELLNFIFQIPVLMIGFYFGPFVFRFWDQKEEIFEQVDKIESGEIAIKEELREAAQKTVRAVKETLRSTPHDTEKPEEPALVPPDAKSVPEASSAKPEEVPEPQPDPKELMQKYLRRD